ncbi:MAG TPA: PDZ domain-containing protein [Steroidobacteraceae bacterium]|jgi:C-terminal processing protease CtpA/Prc|nr:PDZ domain-containing protein [Steroidobacteraceae bacterium]
MNRSLVLIFGALLAACAAAVSCRPMVAVAAVAAPAEDDSQQAAEASRKRGDDSRREAEQEKLEAQLEAARKQLEAAAHQVAELTAQMSRPVIEGFKDFDWESWDEHGRAIIGVQLDPAPGGAGARVRAVSPGGPAAEAGIHAGDVIVAVNGTEVKGDNPARQVMRLIRAVKPDSKVSVRVQRDGATRDFAVTARSGPDVVFAHEGLPGVGDLLSGFRGPLLLQRPLMDMELATLTPQLGRYFGSDKGVLVVRAPADGVLKLEDGDVILAIDGREPSSGSHATRILGSYQPGEKVTLRIVRLHKTQDISTTLPERLGERHATARDARVRALAPMPPAAPLPPAAPAPAGVVIMRDQT